MEAPANKGRTMKIFYRMATVLLLFAASAAHSLPVTWVYEATINFVSSPTTVALGDRVTGTITFDVDAVLTPGTITKTELAAASFPFHPFMNEVSRWGQAVTFGGTSILDLSFTVDTAGGPIAFSAPAGPDVFDLLRHRENEFVPVFDAPASAFDTFFAHTADDVTGEQIGMRLMTDHSPSGIFPLDSLLTTPPDLADLFLGRVHYTGDIGGETIQFFANFDRLAAVRVPEPATLALFGFGLFVLVTLRRRETAASRA